VSAAEEPFPDEPPSLSRRERLELRRKRRLNSTMEWVIVIGAAVMVAVLLRTFVVQTFYIPSDSMVPTLQRNDRVVVNKLSYHMHAVHRGDIVVFTTPPGVNKSFKDLVKRVIGLPGETVSAQHGKVFVNGRELTEPYLPKDVTTNDFGPVRVPPDSLWVMGDNRGDSEDSRVFHAIPERTVVGRVFVRIWPFSRIGLL
jgi:signal peptidase I